MQARWMEVKDGEEKYESEQRVVEHNNNSTHENKYLSVVQV